MWLLFFFLAFGDPSIFMKKVELPVPPRIQWETNYGYCGEVSFISGGLYYGQYLSQYDARRLASGGNQNSVDSQLLLGVNDLDAAKIMRLNVVPWRPGDGDTSATFLSWVKKQLIAGHPVAIAVYMNMPYFGEKGKGDADYDHIVLVNGFLTNHEVNDDSYYDDDILILSDNGLAESHHLAETTRFLFPFKNFQNSRDGANLPESPLYSLPSVTQDYGTAFTGTKGKAVPLSVTTDKNYESPVIADGSNQRPTAMALGLDVSASGLDPDVGYNLYWYTSFDSVPVSDFNAHAADAKGVWPMTPGHGRDFTLEVPIQSSDTAIFRLVPAADP